VTLSHDNDRAAATAVDEVAIEPFGVFGEHADAAMA